MTHIQNNRGVTPDTGQEDALGAKLIPRDSFEPDLHINYYWLSVCVRRTLMRLTLLEPTL